MRMPWLCASMCASFLPITSLLSVITYLLIYLLTYLLTYFNHVACSVSLQPTAQLDARSVALHCGSRDRHHDLAVDLPAPQPRRNRTLNRGFLSAPKPQPRLPQRFEARSAKGRVCACAASASARWWAPRGERRPLRPARLPPSSRTGCLRSPPARCRRGTCKDHGPPGAAPASAGAPCARSPAHGAPPRTRAASPLPPESLRTAFETGASA